MKTQAPSGEHQHATDALLDEQAWEWMRLLTSGRADTEDADRFRRWVQSSPSHRTAYSQARHRWDALREPAGALRAQPATAKALAATLPDARSPRSRQSRRAFLGMAVGGAVAAVAGIGVLHPPLGLWPEFEAWSADDRTAIGEQRVIGMAGRYNVTLNTQTSVRRRTAQGDTVGVDLLGGELAVDIDGRAGPFVVAAGRGRSEADTGRFEVRYLDGKVCVTCLEGTVRVSHPAGERTLQARQQTVYSDRSVSGIAGIDPAAESAWRRGELVFNDIRLADAVREINRYRSGRVVLMNDDMRDKAVSGRFAIASLDLALLQLEHALGLKASALPGGVVLLS